MKPFSFISPQNEKELLDLLDKQSSLIIAGGTNVVPKLGEGRIHTDSIIDISRISSLRYIKESAGEIQIGPLTTHTELVDSQVIKNRLPMLGEAALTIGCVQTRNRGTIGGNIGNASPAADVLVALLALESDLVLQSKEGTRNLSVQDFVLGPEKTAIRSEEYISAIKIKIRDE